MIPFLKKKGAVESFVPRGQGGVASDAKRQFEIYNDTSELPEYRELLTISGNESFAVRESLHQCVAALCLKSSVLLLATEEFRSDTEYLSLKQRLAAHYSSVTEADANPAVLLSLYSQNSDHGKKAERKEGDEALSHTLFQDIAEQAVRERCTDIHAVIMDDAKSAVILFRIDGIIYLKRRIPVPHAVAAFGVAFNKLADKGTRSEGAFNRSLKQSAKIPVTVDGNAYTLRWQSIDVAGGFKVILRILQTSHSKDSEAKSFEELGYSADQCRQLHTAARKPKGLTVIAGPTGSGKSTTLKTLMTCSPTRHQRIQYSFEEPVEYKMFGVSQLSRQRSATETDTKDVLAAILAILRGDPDELMVGEIRDHQMASLVKMFVQSGHKSATSLHASSAIEIIGRLTSSEIGMPREVMDGRNFITALICQLLVPLLCTECRIPAYEASDDFFPKETRNALRNRFAVDPDRMFVTNPVGCAHCDNKGTNGQTVIAEVVRPDITMRRLFGKGLDAEAEELWRSSRIAAFDEEDCTGKTYLEHGIYKASIGIIDPVTLEALTEPLDDYQIFEMKGDEAC